MDKYKSENGDYKLGETACQAFIDVLESTYQ